MISQRNPNDMTFAEIAREIASIDAIPQGQQTPNLVRRRNDLVRAQRTPGRGCGGIGSDW